MLTEMRFHIPGSETASEDPVEAFRDQVMKKASIVVTSGDAIAIFREIHCLSPRGRYDIKVFPTFVHLHGKTFDYKISASSIMRLFILPHKDQRQMHFCINIDPPLKQGQTRYHYLVFNFKQEEEEEIELPFTDEELQEKYEGKLEREMKGPTYEVISKLLKAITGKKITIPGNFLGHSGTPAITCSHKAASGFLYPLERGFIYIYKPPIFIRYDEVRAVNFERSGGSTRSFDIVVSTANDLDYTFSSIEKGEYNRLYSFLKEKKLNVKTSGKGGTSSGLNFEDESVDHRLEMVKANAKEELGSDDDSMSSDDSDFNPDNLEALSAKEEYDSEPSETSSDEASSEGESGSDAERRRAERRKKKEEKREKREKREKSGATKEKKERKKTKTKLPGQPKKNLSAYMIWMNENRDKIRSQSPGMSVAEIGKKAGEMWRNLDDKKVSV
jgi:structure-specific recognition protein 1